MGGGVPGRKAKVRQFQMNALFFYPVFWRNEKKIISSCLNLTCPNCPNKEAITFSSCVSVMFLVSSKMFGRGKLLIRGGANTDRNECGGILKYTE